MALLWMEGWEWLTGSESRDDVTTRMEEHRYWSTSIGTGAGALFTSRGSFQGLELDSGHLFYTPSLKDFGASTEDTFIGGLYLKTPSSLGATNLFRVYCGPDVQFTITILATGELELNRGTSTSISTTTTQLVVSNEYYLEFKVKVDNSAGTFEVKIADITLNGDDATTSTDHTDTGLDTRATSLGTEVTWDRVRLSSTMNSMLIDDLYICDGSGSVNNDFLGNLYVETIEPDGAGTTTDLTPSAGSNYQNVDEATIDGDTTYNTADADNEIDLYTMTDVTNPGDIAGVQVQANVRITESDPRQLSLLTRHGTTNGEGDTFTIADDNYRGRLMIHETNPDTAVAWTNADITAIECGIKRQG